MFLTLGEAGELEQSSGMAKVLNFVLLDFVPDMERGDMLRRKRIHRLLQT